MSQTLSQLYITWHDRYSFGMDGTEICVLKQLYKKTFRCDLKIEFDVVVRSECKPENINLLHSLINDNKKKT